MGITIKCKKNGESIDVSYFGFNRLRNKIAELVSDEVAAHYKQLDDFTKIPYEDRKKFFADYDEETERMIQEKKLPIKVADFLYQSDCEGKICYGACKELLKIIGEYDDDIRYGYTGRKDCAMFKDFKRILEDCVTNKCYMEWL